MPDIALLALIVAVIAGFSFALYLLATDRGKKKAELEAIEKSIESVKENSDAQANPFPDAAAANDWLSKHGK